MTQIPDQLTPDRNEQAAYWWMALSERALAPTDQSAFDRWIDDPDNAAALDAAAMLWNTSTAAAQMPELIQLRGAALEHFRQTNERRWTLPRSLRWYGFGAAAAAMIVALLGTWMLMGAAHVYQTGTGERRVAILADGSRLSLDADTEVRVRLSPDRRSLELLRGRAKFDVAKDPLRPFVVRAGGEVVVATGTSFSVELLKDKVHILLFEGHVTVVDDARPGTGDVARGRARMPDGQLTPGKELVIAPTFNAAPMVRPIDPVRSSSWESGQLSFDDEPLSSAVERVNRYSPAKVGVIGARADGIRVSGVFTAGDTGAFVEAVAALNAVRVVQQDQKTLIVAQ